MRYWRDWEPGAYPKDSSWVLSIVVDYGLVPKEHVDQWKSGANVFAPGTFDIIHEAVERNLTTR